MVRALCDDRKTQTRRLATSPLRRVEVGDRLYVRESFAVRSVYSDVVEVGYMAHERASHTEFVEQIPVALASSAVPTWPSYKPSIHMPRWASRLTLIVEGIKVEALQSISEDDCIAEGAKLRGWMEGLGRPLDGWMVETEQPHVNVTPRWWYRELWSSLHPAEGQHWDDNPDVVALTFRVVRGNIDRIAA